MLMDVLRSALGAAQTGRLPYKGLAGGLDHLAASEPCARVARRLRCRVGPEDVFEVTVVALSARRRRRGDVREVVRSGMDDQRATVRVHQFARTETVRFEPQ